MQVGRQRNQTDTDLFREFADSTGRVCVCVCVCECAREREIALQFLRADIVQALTGTDLYKIKEVCVWGGLGVRVLNWRSAASGAAELLFGSLVTLLTLKQKLSKANRKLLLGLPVCHASSASCLAALLLHLHPAPLSALFLSLPSSALLSS